MTQAHLSDFADKLNQIMPQLLREFARRQVNELYKGKITLPQFLILDFLYRETESKMTTIAHFMQVSTAAMSGIVDRLVRSGYILRVYEPKDRRIIKVKLTSKGNALVKKINQQRRMVIINIFSRISQADRQDYLRVLTRIKDILAEEKQG